MLVTLIPVLLAEDVDLASLQVGKLGSQCDGNFDCDYYEGGRKIIHIFM